MCLFPRIIKNPKYTVTKKNGGNIPICTDDRVKYVCIGCGKCVECLRQKANQWRIRLEWEIKDTQCYFVTLTFSPESLEELKNRYNIGECNAIAGKALRLMCERYRKKYKKAMKHFLITEMGHQGTERIHMHGILFDYQNVLNTEEITKLWNYGFVYNGEYVNSKTINYILKYVTKLDTDHKGYQPQIFASKGLGKKYTETRAFQMRKYNGKETLQYYVTNKGIKYNMPIYYRNKLYNDEEREKLFIQNLDKHQRYVNGILCKNIDTPEGEKHLNNVLKEAQEENNKQGFGNLSKEWKKKEYNITLRMLNKSEKCKVDITKSIKQGKIIEK